MTDTRLRGEWLNAIRYDDLSDAAWRVFTNAMMWCNENGTDGRMPDRYLRMTHPDGVQASAYAEMERAGLWTRTQDGYVFTDWDGALGQEKAEVIEAKREKWRQRQRDKRERERDSAAKASVRSSLPTFKPVTGDITGGHPTVTSGGDVGTGTGTGTGTAVYEGVSENDTFDSVNEQTGEVSSPAPSWNVKAIPVSTPSNGVESSVKNSTSPGKCRVCSDPLYSPPSLASGMCRKGDAAHVAAKARVAA